jgi:hypothetical protein
MGLFGKLRNSFGRVVFLTIRKSENIVWQLLIRIVKNMNNYDTNNDDDNNNSKIIMIIIK